MKYSLFVLSLICMICCMEGISYPCSSVFVNRGDVKLVGRTMDWRNGDGHVRINKRGVKKKAIYLQDKSMPAAWTSKYGSVTFNLEMKFGLIIRVLMFVKGMVNPSSPSCGMNEKGLWGGSLWLHTPPAVKYPGPDGRKTINDWQWLEYILDTCSSVQDVIDHISEIRVSGFKEGDFEVDLHWYFADSTGDSAIIEFPDGQLRIHRRPVPPVMTNSFFEHSRDYVRNYMGFGGNTKVPLKDGETTSENRFLFASTILNEKLKKKSVTREDVFDIMKSATQTVVRHTSTSQAVTQWTTVYDLARREIFWTSRTNQLVRSIKLKNMNFKSVGRDFALDINAALSGDVSDRLK